MRAMCGHSLLELLMALAVAVILLQVGVGGFSHLAASTEQRNAIQELAGTIERARRLAVTMRRQTIVCPMETDASCGENWNSGNFAVFVDTNKNRKQDDGEPLQLLQSRSGQSRPGQSRSGQRLKISWSNWLGDSTITFRSDGTIISNGTLTLSDASDKTIAQLVLNKGGRLRIDMPR
jgi:Tfp pilus assembly protein FimT